MSKPPTPEEQARLFRLAGEADLKNNAKVSAIKESLEKASSVVFIVPMKVNGIDYGDVYFKRWTSSQVNEILASPVYQKAMRELLDLKDLSIKLNESEHRQLFALMARYVAKSCRGVSEKDLLKAEDYSFVHAMWHEISKRSFFNPESQEEVLNFSRPTKASSTASSGSNK